MRRIALFARPPVPGLAKTRLSPSLPPALAAAVASALLADTARVVAATSAGERAVWWAEASGQTRIGGLDSQLQQGADLGGRLRHAFGILLHSKESRALVLGSDTPALEASHVEAAFVLLDSHDVVLGPARDGGYWCVGLKQPAAALFRDIPWSTDGVLEATRERARAAGLTVALAAPLSDLDTPADLARVIGDLARGARACGPALQGTLRQLGLTPEWLGRS